MDVSLRLRTGRLPLTSSSSACLQRRPGALIHRPLSSNRRNTGTSMDVFCFGRRADQQRAGKVPPAAAGGGSTAVEKDSKLKLAKGDAVNCRIHSIEGLKTPLELLLSFVGDQGSEVGTPVDLSTFARVPWTENGKVLGTTYEGHVDLPANARQELIALKVKPKAKADKEFINKIDITATNEAGEKVHINTAPNSWIHKNQGTRIFYATGLAYLPNDTPAALQARRQAELEETRGSKTQQVAQRQDGDRVYGYDVYNDLAGPDKERAVLGGNNGFPYPRRIRTGRPLIPGPGPPGTTYEVRGAGAPWLPLDERFNSVKQANFSTYAVMAVIPTLGKTLKQLLGRDLTSFKQVDAMYAKLKDTSAKDLLGEESKGNTGPIGAVLSSINAIKDMVGGLAHVLEFPPPLVVKNRPKEWTLDSEWGRQALAGVNPSLVTAVTSRAQLGGIKDTHLAPALEGASVDDLIAASASQPRLLVIDNSVMYKDYVKKLTRKVKNMGGSEETRHGYYGRAVLFRGKDKLWRPVAIELIGGDDEQDVYTPADHPNLWLLAKGVFNSVDSSFHQLITHWLRTHACTEPYIISTHRNLSELHPVYKLMVPHWAFTMEINANARAALINAGGIIESVFTPGNYAMEMSSKVYGKAWQFNKEGLPNDLIARGLAKRDAEGKVKLLLEDYPYADDGMLLWDAVDSWVGDYLGLYYDDSVDSKKVTNDKELQAWWEEIKTQGHPDKKEGWPELKTVADLKQILGTMIWIVSGHHSAINFSQYAYTGYILNRPNVCTKKIPKRDSEEFKRLVASKENGERVYLETLNTDFSLLGVLTVELLATHADNEAYLGDADHSYILDPVALEKYSKFVANIKGVEAEINARNKRPDLKLRSGLAYELLAPTSGPGLTNRGVPQSISI